MGDTVLSLKRFERRLPAVDRRLVLLAVAALALELWALFSDVHFLWRSPHARPEASRIAQAVSVIDRALVRSPLQLNWSRLRAGQELFEGDEVATVGTSSAMLKFADGQTVTLGSDSFLLLKSSRFLRQRSFQLTLLQGSLSQESDGKAAGQAEGEKGRLEIEVGGQKVISTGDASFRVENSEAGGPRIDLGKGQVQVTDVTGRPLSAPVETASVPGVGTVALAELRPARVVSPSAGETLFNPEAVVLKWSSRDGVAATARVEIARDPEFRNIVVRQEVPRQDSKGEGSFVFRPERKGRYYWRVARADGDCSAVSEAASFEVKRRLGAPTLERPRVVSSPARARGTIDAPLLKRPVIRYEKDDGAGREHGSWFRRALGKALAALDGALVTDARAEEGAAPGNRYTVDLEWEPVPGARAYVLQIATDSGFQHLSAEKILAAPRFSWRTDLAGFYYWRVAGVDADGDRGPFSEFMTFTIKAERNRIGDETSYETYLKFDEYSRHQQSLMLSYGPEWTRYYFSSTDRYSPDSAVYRKGSPVNGEVSYDYRLSPYYSAQFSLRLSRASISAGDYENRPAQETLSQDEDDFALGIERRFFEPRHYYVLQAGVRVSYIDMPVLGASNDLVYDSFGFFGLYVAGGAHVSLGKGWEAALRLGGIYQYTGDSFRVAEYAAAEVRHPILDWMDAGVSLEQELAAYRFDSDKLVGQAHSLSFRPMVFVGFSF